MNLFRNILIFGIVFLMLVKTLFLISKHSKPIVNLPKQDILIEIKQKDSKVPEIVKEFNEINKKITSFNSDMRVRIWDNGMRFKVSGSLFYSKPNLFHMQTWFVMGKELDLGSNSTQFWYWSKRDKNPGLYYSSYEDYHNTRLKNPFNPIFMRESLGLDEIDVTDAKIIENDKTLSITWRKVNASNEKILYSMFLNKSDKRIQGTAISDLSENILACSEIQYIGVVPKRILYDWKEEKRSLVIEFRSPQINQDLSKHDWELPDYSPKINMGKE